LYLVELAGMRLSYAQIAILAMTASLAASSGQAQEEGHVVNNVPDYVATREYSGPPTRQVNVRHHGGWLRVDGERSSHFEGPGHRVWFVRALDGDRYDWFDIKQEVGAGWTRLESVKTGKLETYLGETCTIWDLVHPADPVGRRVSFRDCITHDGIQMAHGWAAEDGGIREPPEWRLTSLTRTAVSEEETSPPAELFDWRNFTGFAAATPSLEAETEPDFVATMDGHYASDAGVRYRKRHFPWLRTGTKFANGAWIIEIVNERNHAGLSFRALAQGAFYSLSINEPQIWTQDSWSAAGSDAEQKDVIVKLGTLLGQECKITTDMRSERIRTEWRTADGIVLKEEEVGGRAPNPEDWTVVELQRRAVELSEVMPPADIFERARWGLSR
jgi:hypothetical protein